MKLLLILLLIPQLAFAELQAIVTWEPPIAYEDESILDPNDIEGYRVFANDVELNQSPTNEYTHSITDDYLTIGLITVMKDGRESAMITEGPMYTGPPGRARSIIVRLRRGN